MDKRPTKSGWKLSAEAKAKMRKAWERRRLTPFSAETRAKMSKSRTAHKNPNWKGGLLKHKRAEAKLRDNNTCQICGFREDEIMVVDHIRPRAMRPELALDLDNLMTLCPNCHARKTKVDRKMIAQFRRTEIVG